MSEARKFEFCRIYWSHPWHLRFPHHAYVDHQLEVKCYAAWIGPLRIHIFTPHRRKEEVAVVGEEMSAIRHDVVTSAKIRIDIGCGASLQQGWVGIDARAFDDYPRERFIRHDIEDIPWPLPDSCASVIQASHIMEHVLPRKFIPVMDEMWRVLEHEGQAWITGPYGWSHGFVQDPTHTKPLNETLFEYFTPKSWAKTKSILYEFYKPKPWTWVQVPQYSTGGNLIVILATQKEKDE